MMTLMMMMMMMMSPGGDDGEVDDHYDVQASIKIFTFFTVNIIVNLIRL